jgi:UDP-N-acetyl-D-glucosamine/UDP-N-acetyl-D-galactosamine dehydrogenase
MATFSALDHFRRSERLGVVGLGYVGLPVAVALANHFSVIGFDIDADRIMELESNIDRTSEVPLEALEKTSIEFSVDPIRLRDCTFIIVTVPTPIDTHHSPDFGPLRTASESIGANLSPGSVVVYESTVYPGATEQICRPILERASGLKAGTDFFVGYSPERINPGDKEHTIDKIVKVIAAQDPVTLERLKHVYGSVCLAGLHVAPSIEVAEAAKVIENTQRDLNIALMNELAMIFDRLEISTHEVLAAARTKWNFLNFVPGLVGGHCIGVDPFYLTKKAQSVGYHPEVILTGRRVNDQMGTFIATKIIKLLAAKGLSAPDASVLVVGLTFKEDISDLRNSRVVDLIRELIEFGASPDVFDPVCDPSRALLEFGLTVRSQPPQGTYDCVVIAVPHRQLRENQSVLASLVKSGGVVVDVKSVVDRDLFSHATVWSL